MTFGFHPYSKEEQLKATEKLIPKKKRIAKKKKRQPLKQEVYKGRVIPKKSARGRITRKEYIKAQKAHGEYCFICQTTVGLEAHHIKFRSAEGRGQWRNIRFLCGEHHRGAYSPHRDRNVRRALELMHEDLYGPHYFKDVYDLFKEGLVENTTPEAYEEFMQRESDRLENQESLD